ncbi:hypothetical protein [Cellulomonas sp. NPDC089187]|uniref:hypothetical protein n=1 Tax=Cellulomonas sp. NPDC089187 TaxID=3154970 RepID=UPI003431040C
MRELIAVGVLTLVVLGAAYVVLRWAERWWRDTDDAWPTVARVLRGIQRTGLRPERVAVALVLSFVTLGVAVAVAICGATVLPTVVVLYLALALVVIVGTRGEPVRQRVWSSTLGVLVLALSLAWTAFCAQWDFSGAQVMGALAVLVGGVAAAALTGWADSLAHRWTARAQGRRRPMPS